MQHDISTPKCYCRTVHTEPEGSPDRTAELRSLVHPEDGSSMFLRNTGTHLPDRTAQHEPPRSRNPQTLHLKTCGETGR